MRTHKDQYLHRNRDRIKNNPDIIKRRQSIVEHPFSCIKNHILAGGFLVKGFKMVKAEFSLAQLAYNFKRIRNIKDSMKRKKNRSFIVIYTFNKAYSNDYKAKWAA